MPGFLGRLLLFADLLATVRSREEKFYFSDDDDYDSTDADTSLGEPASAAAVADPDGLGYKVGSHFHLNLEDNLKTTRPPPTTAQLPEYPSWRAGDAPIETTTGDLPWGATPSSALFDVDTGDSNLKERSSIRPETSPHAESSSTTTVTSTTTTATTTKPTYTPASRIQETSTSLDMDCPDGYEARGLWVLINDPTRGYRKGKHESIAAVSLICDDHLEQLKSSPSTPKASSQQQWTRLACMDRPDGQRVVISAISTAAESESSEAPLMELRLQCSDGITVYGYAPTESRRMWREGEPCKEGMTAKGVRMAMKEGEMMSISTQCATACTRHDCGFQELRGSSSADHFTSVCGYFRRTRKDIAYQTSFVATSQSLSRIPLPSVPEVVAETAPAPLFPPQPSLMSRQIQQQTEVAQQANLQAIDEQRISQIERQENKLDAGMGELTATLDLSRKNLTSIKGALTEGLKQNAKTIMSLVGDIASLIGTAIPTPSKDEDPMAILNRAEEMLRQQVVTARANGSFPPVPPQEQEKVKALSDAVGNIIRAETLNRNRIDQLSKAFESLHTELSEAGHLKDNHLVADSDYVSLLSADLNSVREGMDEDINSLHHISDVQARSMQALRSSLRALSKKVDSMVDKEEKDTEENSSKEETDAEEVDEELTARLESLEAKVRFLQNPANRHIFNPEDRVEEEKIGLIEKQLRTMVQRTSASTIRAHVDDAIEESKQAYGSTALSTPPGYVAIAGLLLALAAVGMGYVGFERSDKQLQDITYLNEQVSEIIQRIWPEGEEEYYGEEAAEEYAEEEQDVGEVAQISRSPMTIPRSRAERQLMKDRDAVEKQRLRNRTGGYHRYEPFNNVTGVAEGCPADAGPVERFVTTSDLGQDLNRAEHEAFVRRRAECAESLRKERFDREAERWSAIEKNEQEEKERQQRLQADPILGRKNTSGQAYDIVGLGYHDTEEGRRLKYHDELIKWRGKLRANHLAARNHLGFNPITGESSFQLQHPRKPDPETAKGE
ncbi:hypothetical protein FOZ61_009380 [Perkinsus olseni]|uniref:Uncharacterized protein n=1 Tax=Perkinsus olseni TaxID=32597 RepID=A0A7J6M5K0_PEROL|nr:hypothetical protein FOZ61_009380 [Perkinsus olseni]